MKITLKYFILFLCFAIGGYLIYDVFFSQSLSQLKSNNLAFSTSSLTGQFNGFFMFCIAIGAIPLLYLFAHLIAKLQSRKQSTLVYSIIIVTGLIFWQLRINYLNGVIEPFNKNIATQGIQNSIDIGNLKFSKYVLFGLISGAIIGSGIFKLINRSKKTVGNNR